MAIDVVIEEIRASQDRLGVPDLEYGMRRPEFQLTIVLRNGGSRRVQAVSNVRYLSYDENARRLTVGLESAREGDTGHSFDPAIVAIPPGAVQEMVVTIPLEIRQFRQGDGLGGTIETIDLRGLREIECRIMVASVPDRREAGNAMKAFEQGELVRASVKHRFRRGRR
jgi:hypothetical protein